MTEPSFEDMLVNGVEKLVVDRIILALNRGWISVEESREVARFCLNGVEEIRSAYSAAIEAQTAAATERSILDASSSPGRPVATSSPQRRPRGSSVVPARWVIELFDTLKGLHDRWPLLLDPADVALFEVAIEMTESRKRSSDYYAALQIDPRAEPSIVRAAYRRLAREYHPDTGKSEDDALMRLINEAAEVLLDESRRRDHESKRLNDRRVRARLVARFLKEIWLTLADAEERDQADR